MHYIVYGSSSSILTVGSLAIWRRIVITLACKYVCLFGLDTFREEWVSVLYSLAFLGILLPGSSTGWPCEMKWNVKCNTNRVCHKGSTNRIAIMGFVMFFYYCYVCYGLHLGNGSSAYRGALAPLWITSFSVVFAQWGRWPFYV